MSAGLAFALGIVAAILGGLATFGGERWAWRRAVDRLNAERHEMGLCRVYPTYPELPQTGLFPNEWR